MSRIERVKELEVLHLELTRIQEALSVMKNKLRERDLGGSLALSTAIEHVQEVISILHKEKKELLLQAYEEGELAWLAGE